MQKDHFLNSPMEYRPFFLFCHHHHAFLFFSPFASADPPPPPFFPPSRKLHINLISQRTLFVRRTSSHHIFLPSPPPPNSFPVPDPFHGPRPSHFPPLPPPRLASIPTSYVNLARLPYIPVVPPSDPPSYLYFPQSAAFYFFLGLTPLGVLSPFSWRRVCNTWLTVFTKILGTLVPDLRPDRASRPL